MFDTMVHGNSGGCSDSIMEGDIGALKALQRLTWSAYRRYNTDRIIGIMLKDYSQLHVSKRQHLRL